jgi:hypothetical protein
MLIPHNAETLSSSCRDPHSSREQDPWVNRVKWQADKVSSPEVVSVVASATEEASETEEEALEEASEVVTEVDVSLNS